MRVAAPSTLQIRQRRSVDDAFLAGLAGRAFAEYDPHPTASMRRLVQRGSTWVAWQGDEPVGFAVVHPLSGDGIDLCAIAVEEQARGRGVGRALLAHIERVALGAGRKEIRLHTAQSNLSALELFLRCGFRLEQRMPRFYRDMYDACAMVKLVGSRLA